MSLSSGNRQSPKALQVIAGTSRGHVSQSIARPRSHDSFGSKSPKDNAKSLVSKEHKKKTVVKKKATKIIKKPTSKMPKAPDSIQIKKKKKKKQLGQKGTNSNSQQINNKPLKKKMGKKKKKKGTENIGTSVRMLLLKNDLEREHANIEARLNFEARKYTEMIALGQRELKLISREIEQTKTEMESTIKSHEEEKEKLEGTISTREQEIDELQKKLDEELKPINSAVGYKYTEAQNFRKNNPLPKLECSLCKTREDEYQAAKLKTKEMHKKYLEAKKLYPELREKYLRDKKEKALLDAEVKYLKRKVFYKKIMNTKDLSEDVPEHARLLSEDYRIDYEREVARIEYKFKEDNPSLCEPSEPQPSTSGSG